MAQMTVAAGLHDMESRGRRWNHLPSSRMPSSCLLLMAALWTKSLQMGRLPLAELASSLGHAS